MRSDRRGLARRAAPLALIAVLAGCGETTTDPPPRTDGTIARFEASSVLGQHSTVRSRGPARDVQVREVHFLARKGKRVATAQADECVDHYVARGVEAVYCYAYASRAAFRAAGFNAATGRTRRACWSARAYRSIAGSTDASVGPPRPACG